MTPVQPVRGTQSLLGEDADRLAAVVAAFDKVRRLYGFKRVEVPKFVNEFIVKLVRATRPKDPTAPDMIKRLVDWGGGPRAGIFLIQGARAMAAMDGRFSVAVDDVKKVAIPVLRHRVSTNFQAQAEGKTSEDVIANLVETVKEPDVEKYDKRKK